MSLSSFSLCLALKSLMFHSNLGLINTVSSVRSKPSFEVKLVSLRSSGGREKAKLKSDSHSVPETHRLPGMQATASLLGLLPSGTCTVHGQRQNKPQLCLVHWPFIQITRYSAVGQVQFCAAVVTI